MTPRPPALLTAAASSGPVTKPMGAAMIGSSMPSRSQRRVLSTLSRRGRGARRQGPGVAPRAAQVELARAGDRLFLVLHHLEPVRDSARGAREWQAAGA